ncbi:MAG: type II toxin-antitoxin system RelE/ParE family toxin [Spirochaetota bacterium]
MIYRHIIRPEAETDLFESSLWYDEQRTGLGDEFIGCIEAKIAEIIRNPVAFPVIDLDVRRALIRRFPFGIFFTVRADTIYVVAILHLTRHEDTWKTRG